MNPGTNPDGIELESPELLMLRANKIDGFKYRERRQDDWTENYTLYRDKPVVNRLIQRQSVNIPVMKQTIRTLLKDVDDMPLITFENLDNDKDKEIFQNEHWKVTLEQNNAEVLDIVDKRQVFMFGRTFDQWQIIDGKIAWNIEDPEDILVQRYMNPYDLDSSRFLIHTHIFVPIGVLEENDDYDKTAIHNLKEFYATQMGLLRQAQNSDSLARKNQKLADMGLGDVDQPILGETYVEISMHFVFRKEADDEDEQIYLYVEADDQVILMKKRLEEVIGKTVDNYWRNHYPYTSWADDVDKQDFWTDGVADIVRTPNKVVNSWFSSLVENRTLKNLNMNLFDSTIEGFSPQTWEPMAFGMYGVPVPQGRSIKDVFTQVPVADLSDSLDELQFVLNMVERASGATSTQQGVQNDRQVTLGEIKLALTEAKDRVKGMSKFYTPAWKQRATKYLKLIEAAPDKIDMVTVFKKGRNTDQIYKRDIRPKDWMTKSGYTTRIWSQDEKDTVDTNNLQKLNAAKSTMPSNNALTEIYDRKMLEFAGLKPEEIGRVLDEEKQRIKEQEMATQANEQALLSQNQSGGAIPGQPSGLTPPPTASPQPPMGGQQQPALAPAMA